MARQLRTGLTALILASAWLASAWLVATPTPAIASGTQFSQTCGNPGTPGPVHHVVWIWMENENYNSVINNANAPFQTSLAHQCGLPTNFHNESHGSTDNYIAATDGQNILGTNFINDCTPNPAAGTCVTSAPSIFSQLDASGGTWRGYDEDMPVTCDRANSGNYAIRHNPAPYYSGLASCAQSDIAMGDAATQTGPFYDDVRNGTLPNFSFISPNLLDDAHSSDTAVGDAWLSNLIPFITSNANYQSGDTAIFITNDEGGGTDFALNEDCTNPTLDANQPSCHIPTIVVAPYVHTGTVDGTFYTHYSMLRTAEELLGLPLLGAAASAPSMTASFNLGPGSTSSPSPPTPPASLTTTAIGPTQVGLSWAASTPGNAPIAGYQVSRNGSVIATTSGTTYTDTTVAPNTSYIYTVAAVDTTGLASLASNAVTAVTAATANLLTNPGFESWSAGAPTGWTVWGGATTTMTQSSDAHSGSSSVTIATTSTTGSAPGLNDGKTPTISSTQPGITYVASCWVKASKANAVTLKIQLHETKANGTSVADAVINSLVPPTSTSWYPMQVSATTVGSGDRLPLSLYSTSTKAGNPTYEVDDCSLAPMSSGPTFPSQPGPLTATTNGTAEVDLSWGAAAGATSYIVQRGAGGTGAFSADLGTVTGTTFADTNLIPGSYFDYRVVPTNTAGAGPASNTATATTLPAQTTGLAATAISASEVDLAWSQAAGAATYIAQRAPSGTSNWTTLAAGLTATAFADTTVAPGTSYDYRVTAVDAAGNGQASATATALTGPGAPALTASTPSTSEIDLSWTAGSGATSYDVQRGVVGSGTFGTDLGSTSTTTFADQGLDPGSSYDYRVVPSGAAGQGVPSNVVTGTTLPAQVTGLSATAVSPTEVDLSWPSAAGAVTYLVQRAPTGTTAWTVVSAGASNLTLADTGLAPNTGYDYEVAGVDAGGTGAFSTIQTATTPAAPPAQVTGLTATAVSTTEIDLGWTPTPGATSYEVDRSTSPTDGFSPIATGLASPSFADTTPAPQTTYWYQVIAGNPTGTGPASTAASTATLPDQVTGLGATAISASEIDLAWNPAGGAITYVVQRAPSGSGNWTTLSAGASSTALADTAVSAGTSYDYRVAATGVGGTGAFSTTQSATTPQQIPQQVTGLTATSASAAEIDLTWTPAAGATGYEVDRSTSPTTGFTSVATGLSTTSFADTTASSNTTYWYQVIAGNSAGPAPASDPTSATTRPDQVSGLSATAVSPAEVDLSWNPVGGATGYLVRRAPAGTGNWTTIAPNVSVTSFADQTVAPTTGYDYQVAAIGVGGTGAFSAIQSATTPLAPPAQVTGLTATAVSGSEIDLSWATTQGATGYEVDRSATSATGGYAPLTTGLTSTSFADKSVSAGTTYWYEVKASNQAGPGPASTAASATTPSSTPALLSNGFEGGSSGSAITAANSGGASGNAFNAVSCTGGAATFTTAAAHGSRAAAFSPTTSACFVQWGTNSIPVPSTTSYGRMYVNLTSATGPTMLLAKLANSAVARDAQIDVSSTGRLALYDANGTVRLTFGTTVPSGWVRIEWKLVNSTTNGSLTVSMYAADSLTPLETHTVTGINTGASFGALQVGSVVATSPAPAPFRIDDVAYGVVGPLGPAH